MAGEFRRKWSDGFFDFVRLFDPESETIEMSTTPNAATPGELAATSRPSLRRWFGADEIAHLVTLIAAAVLVLIAILLVYQLWVLSAEARAKFGWSFFVTKVWDPVSGDFGALPFIYGTLVTSAVALFIAVPLGVGAAIFLAELAPPKLSSSLTFVSDLLAAVPSVIYGLLGVFLLVPLMRTTIQPALKKTLGFLPLFQGPAYGIGFLTAGIVLAIMIVPFVLSVSREVLLAVARDQREAALALGRDQVGIHLESGGAGGADRNFWLRVSRSGARSGRNHGRHHGHRKQSQDCRLAVFSGIFDRVGSGQ